LALLGLHIELSACACHVALWTSRLLSDVTAKHRSPCCICLRSRQWRDLVNSFRVRYHGTDNMKLVRSNGATVSYNLIKRATVLVMT
jgi:hypothetical protein